MASPEELARLLMSPLGHGATQMGKIDDAAIAQAAQRQGAVDNLNGIQSAFLGMLRGAENVVPLHNTATRLFNDVVQRGRVQPVTERDFSKDELSKFEGMVRRHSADTGLREGKIDYPDYVRYQGPDSQILGGFQYSVGNNGDITIKDTYDFNRNRAEHGDDNRALQALAMIVNPRGLAAKIGRDVVPDVPGRGIPVDLFIGGNDQRAAPINGPSPTELARMLLAPQ